MKILFLACFLLVFAPLDCVSQLVTQIIEKNSNNRLSAVDSLIDEIHRLQVKEKSFYDLGQFPSQRGRLKRDDNNIFFSALIAFTLNDLANQLSSTYEKKVDSICIKIKMNYLHYKNKSGIPTYNFWKTDPPLYFPNSIFFRHSLFQLPDDADCTSMIYLTDSSLFRSLGWLQQKFAAHANLSGLKIKNTFKKYRGFKAYSTWFGKKMPVEFDICVQSNVLYLIYKNRLSLSPQDSATLTLIQEQVQSGDYLRYAHYLSPSYKKRSIVLYHLARLLEKNTIPLLEDCRSTIKQDIEIELKKTDNYMDQVILSTALIRLGGLPSPVRRQHSKEDLARYVFFRANFFSSYARPYLSFITKSRLFDSDFYCKAYCLALIAEYELISCSKNPN